MNKQSFKETWPVFLIAMGILAINMIFGYVYVKFFFGN